MTDEGKEVGLRPGDPASDAVTTHFDQTRQTPEQPPQEGDAGSEADHPARGSINAQTRDRLAVQLRAMYDTILQQPVPDRFAQLIERLEAADRK